MQESMMNFVKSAFEDADVLIYMVEIGEQELKDEAFFNKIIHAKIPVLLLLNKIDNLNQAQLEEQVVFGQPKCLMPEIFPISALQNFNVPEVFGRIIELLPESPAYYPKDQLTDKPERFLLMKRFVKNIIELQQRDSVRCRDCNRRIFEDENIIRIRSLIMVERETQKESLSGAALKKKLVDALVI
jgi:GTP-binding protein Era